MSEFINAYIINPEKNGLESYLAAEFFGRDEFLIEIVPTQSSNTTSLFVWDAMRSIISNSMSEKADYILFFTKNHRFTKNYSKKLLFKHLCDAMNFNADILLGGVGSVNSLFRTSETLLWLEAYTESQFMVIFRGFFQTFLDANFSDVDTIDNKISSLSLKKFLAYPFVSDNESSVQNRLLNINLSCDSPIEFEKPHGDIQYILDSEEFYGYTCPHNKNIVSDIDELSIPTYVINLPERSERLNHIMEQFKDKPEFTVTYIEACRHTVGAVGLWLSIRKVIELGIRNEDDVLLICEDDHIFSQSYTKTSFLENVIEAHQKGVDILSGGTGGGFGCALPVSVSRFWVNHFLSTQFIVIYSKFFQKILEAPFDNSVTSDNLLSQLTSNKMIIFPFISTQKDFGYSDVTPIHNHYQGLVTKMFENATLRLERIQKAYINFSLNSPCN